MASADLVNPQAIFILFCYSPVSLGGLGFSESSIGQALALGGALTVTFQLVCFPVLQSRFGTTKLYRTLMALYPLLVFPLFPVMSLAAGRDEMHGSARQPRTWAVLLAWLVVKSVANCESHRPRSSHDTQLNVVEINPSVAGSYACNMLEITSSAPHRSLLGTLNGLAQMLASLCRSIGPIAASSLFAWSKDRQDVLGGNVVWVAVVVFSLAAWAATGLLVDAPSEWRELERKSQEEEDSAVAAVTARDDAE